MIILVLIIEINFFNFGKMGLFLFVEFVILKVDVFFSVGFKLFGNVVVFLVLLIVVIFFFVFGMKKDLFLFGVVVSIFLVLFL